MAALPVIEAGLRAVGRPGIPGSLPFVQHLTLWIAFLGAALAARDGKLLALATGELIPEGKWRSVARIFSAAVGSAVCVLLTLASIELIGFEKEAATTVALDVPVWVAQLAMPIGFALIGLRMVWRSSEKRWGRLLAATGLVCGLVLGLNAEWLEGSVRWPWLAILLLATVLGGPIFTILGGTAVILFMIDAVPAAAVPAETYALTISPTLAAIATPLSARLVDSSIIGEVPFAALARDSR